jgi:hypothetical protein
MPTLRTSHMASRMFQQCLSRYQFLRIRTLCRSNLKRSSTIRRQANRAYNNHPLDTIFNLPLNGNASMSLPITITASSVPLHLRPHPRHITIPHPLHPYITLQVVPLSKIAC